MSEHEHPIFSIGAVARMLECAPATIRTWESRYGLIVPARSSGGQRLYSRAQVEQLRRVQELLDTGLRPGEAHRLLRERDGEAPVPAGATRVLLVENEDGAADVLSQVLGHEGFEVIVVADAAGAERRADEAALCVIDVAREDGEGVELARTLKGRGTPVIVLGGEGAGAEADAHLPLPVEPARLLSAARRLVRA